MAQFRIHKEVPEHNHHDKADLSLHNKFIHEGEIFEGEAPDAAAYVSMLNKTTGVCYAAEYISPAASISQQLGSRRRG
jgi:hypothetical protein